MNMLLVRDFDTYKTLVCDRNPTLDSEDQPEKLSYLQYVYKQVLAQTRARLSVEPNVLDLLVEHQHKSLLTTLPLVQGLLDHKWNMFARQLLKSWGIITFLIFVIFEINVYSSASQKAEAAFTMLELVRVFFEVSHVSDTVVSGTNFICNCVIDNDFLVSNRTRNPSV